MVKTDYQIVDIVNIVVSGTLGQSIHLNNLMSAHKSFDYNPDFYQGGYLHLAKHTVTIYRSGKYIIPGIKSIVEIPLIYSELRASLEGIIDSSKIEEPVIRNIVANDTMNYPLNLSGVCKSLFVYGLTPDYEPETFPGLILKLNEGTINLFSSGKYVLLGAKSQIGLIELNNHFQEIVHALEL